MKKYLALALPAALFTAASVFAAEKSKEVTLTGVGQCAKCALSMTKECQTAIVVKEKGKEVTYMVAQNDVAKGFHKNVCQDSMPIKVTGVVTEKNGQKEITASKIEQVKG